MKLVFLTKRVKSSCYFYNFKSFTTGRYENQLKNIHVNALINKEYIFSSNLIVYFYIYTCIVFISEVRS